MSEPLTEFEYGLHAAKAEENGTLYAKTHPYLDFPLSGEVAGDPTPFSVIVELGLDPYDIHHGDDTGLTDVWETAYWLYWDSQNA